MVWDCIDCFSQPLWIFVCMSSKCSNPQAEFFPFNSPTCAQGRMADIKCKQPWLRSLPNTARRQGRQSRVSASALWSHTVSMQSQPATRGAINRMALKLTQKSGNCLPGGPWLFGGCTAGSNWRLLGSPPCTHLSLCLAPLSAFKSFSSCLLPPGFRFLWLILLLSYHLQVPSHLSSHSLFPLFNLPAFSPPPAMRWRRGGWEARMTEHFYPLPTLSSLPFSLLTFPHFFSLFFLRLIGV